MWLCLLHQRSPDNAIEDFKAADKVSLFNADADVADIMRLARANNTVHRKATIRFRFEIQCKTSHISRQ